MRRIAPLMRAGTRPARAYTLAALACTTLAARGSDQRVYYAWQDGSWVSITAAEYLALQP
ncbi:hypothetical protein KUD11_05200 [Roseovarius sp. LXJ103]|uniref:hypothetical protein n=1 Tax=Roseovarius carneus TaxID=2853164 RepID=UPI000D61205F|nr:hypothetical protein [Roseovarius carneus]MBZ8118039.1 hypothetical protein [Roseovarius carneus]PWE36216.1 hypothetical protein DD563_09765 [Pelagicola sp. LXJ1103]